MGKKIVTFSEYLNFSIPLRMGNVRIVRRIVMKILQFIEISLRFGFEDLGRRKFSNFGWAKSK